MRQPSGEPRTITLSFDLQKVCAVTAREDVLPFPVGNARLAWASVASAVGLLRSQLWAVTIPALDTLTIQPPSHPFQ